MSHGRIKGRIQQIANAVVSSFAVGVSPVLCCKAIYRQMNRRLEWFYQHRTAVEKQKVSQSAVVWALLVFMLAINGILFIRVLTHENGKAFDVAHIKHFRRVFPDGRGKCSPGYFLVREADYLDFPGGGMLGTVLKLLRNTAYRLLTGRSRGRCALCPPGHKKPATDEACTPCSAGEYQCKPGSASCLSCPPGTYQPDTVQTAQTAQTACSVQTACIECGPGFYQPAAGSTACLECSAGWYQPNNGSSACLKCSETLTSQCSEEEAEEGVRDKPSSCRCTEGQPDHDEEMGFFSGFLPVFDRTPDILVGEGEGYFGGLFASSDEEEIEEVNAEEDSVPEDTNLDVAQPNQEFGEEGLDDFASGPIEDDFHLDVDMGQGESDVPGEVPEPALIVAPEGSEDDDTQKHSNSAITEDVPLEESTNLENVMLESPVDGNETENITESSNETSDQPENLTAPNESVKNAGAVAKRTSDHPILRQIAIKINNSIGTFKDIKNIIMGPNKTGDVAAAKVNGSVTETGNTSKLSQKTENDSHPPEKSEKTPSPPGVGHVERGFEALDEILPGVEIVEVETTDSTTTVDSTTVESTIVESANVEPATVESTTVESTTVESATVESTTVESATVESATVEATTVESATVESTTVEPEKTRVTQLVAREILPTRHSSDASNGSSIITDCDLLTLLLDWCFTNNTSGLEDLVLAQFTDFHQHLQLIVVCAVPLHWLPIVGSLSACYLIFCGFIFKGIGSGDAGNSNRFTYLTLIAEMGLLVGLLLLEEKIFSTRVIITLALIYCLAATAFMLGLMDQITKSYSQARCSSILGAALLMMLCCCLLFTIDCQMLLSKRHYHLSEDRYALQLLLGLRALALPAVLARIDCEAGGTGRKAGHNTEMFLELIKLLIIGSTFRNITFLKIIANLCSVITLNVVQLYVWELCVTCSFEDELSGEDDVLEITQVKRLVFETAYFTRVIEDEATVSYYNAEVVEEQQPNRTTVAALLEAGLMIEKQELLFERGRQQENADVIVYINKQLVEEMVSFNSTKECKQYLAQMTASEQNIFAAVQEESSHSDDEDFVILPKILVNDQHFTSDCLCDEFELDRRRCKSAEDVSRFQENTDLELVVEAEDAFAGEVLVEEERRCQSSLWSSSQGCSSCRKTRL